MSTLSRFSVIALAIAGVLSFDMFGKDTPPPVMEHDVVPYPEGYRKWAHVKSAIVGKENPAEHFRGIHHIYANERAVEGYKTGNFPDGSIIVFDVIERIDMANSDIIEGERKFIDVMVKDSNKYDSTGHWGFEEFNGNSMTDRSILTTAGPKCYQCHATRKKNDFVFSQFRN